MHKCWIYVLLCFKIMNQFTFLLVLMPCKFCKYVLYISQRKIHLQDTGKKSSYISECCKYYEQMNGKCRESVNHNLWCPCGDRILSTVFTKKRTVFDRYLLFTGSFVHSTMLNEAYLNPFDTESMAKIAVKMSIMRVVKFMSSPGNDFTSWQKCQQLLFGGQSGDLPLSLHWFPWLPPGGC